VIPQEVGALTLYRFARLAEVPGLVHAVSGRGGGVSGPGGTDLNLAFHVQDKPDAVLENRRRFLSAVGLDALPTASLMQVHRGDARAVDRDNLTKFATGPGVVLPEADALVTALPNVALMVYSADCALVLLCDPAAGVIGAAHASWRSVMQDILGRTVAAMIDLGADSDRIQAGIGPSLGPCCFEVGPDVVDAARGAFAEPDRLFTDHLPRPHFDLWSAAATQLHDAGIPPSHIEQSHLCTVCHNTSFFSHRADPTPTGRLAAVICIRE